ncbi:MAG TPA: MerR family transcriptional regulator [Steroidobacteraceae bacterium]
MALKIGTLAKLTHTTAPTIRYYEKIGLLPPAHRQFGGQRFYVEDDVRRLTFIRRCRDFDLSIEQVRMLVALMRSSDRSCERARDMAQRHLESMRARIVELQALERTVAGLVEACDASRARASDHCCEAWQRARGSA